MPIMCRLLELAPDQATTLATHPDTLTQSVEAARVYSDVYRYWHAIQYLLAQHRPESPAANWLGLGQAVSTATRKVPAARVISPQGVAELDAALGGIEPDELSEHYEASALDQEGIYPRCWQEWEETFDPLGQVLEHYWYLKQFVSSCRSSGKALLLHFVDYEDGTD
jgi:hypothetical protein